MPRKRPPFGKLDMETVRWAIAHAEDIANAFLREAKRTGDQGLYQRAQDQQAQAAGLRAFVENAEEYARMHNAGFIQTCVKCQLSKVQGNGKPCEKHATGRL